MSDPVGVGGGWFPPGHERAKLVAELGRYLALWESQLRSPTPGANLGQFGSWGANLQARAREVGFGGVAHHLSRCLAVMNAGASGKAPDPASLHAVLKDLSELAWQAKQELPPGERALVDRALAQGPEGAEGSGPASLVPPPMLTVHPGLRRQPPNPVGQAEPPPPAPPRIVSPIPPAPPGVRSSALEHQSALGRLGAESPVGPERSSAPSPAVVPPAGAAPPAESAPRAGSAPPPIDQRSIAQPPSPDRARPNLAVRTMFRLRAFGQQGAQQPPANEPSRAPSAAPAAGPSPILGLRGFSNPPPAPGGPPLPSASAPAPPATPGYPGSPGWSPGQGQRASHAPDAPHPRLLSNSLPPLPDTGAARAPTPADGEMADLLGRMGSKRESSSRGRRASKGAKVLRRREPGASFPWWIGVLAALVAGVLTLVVVLAWNRLRQSPDKALNATGSAASSVPSAKPVASSGAAGPEPAFGKPHPAATEVVEDIRVKTHGRGAKESPELKAWVDHQAALQVKLLETGKCEGSAAACAILYRAGEETTLPPGRVVPKKERTPAGTGRSRWLAGLRMPSIPVADDERVKRVFERLTDTLTGREQVQQILFRCGAYRDLIQATLMRYELPPSILAVVFAESGCNPTIRSPVGAEGLWQFMPEAARAYRLHITEDVLDERHSPAKSTEAAVHFLADLYAKFGSWDLAFAAYNMGPYGLAARMHHAGGDVGYWDLLDADLLPAETSNYVPIIEAYALILENLQKLKFGSTQMRPPELTADLDAPPGTRLGLIARAAGTSVNQLRALNPDLKVNLIPTIPGQRFIIQVQKDAVWQARDALDDLRAEGSYEDQCVPDTFDWGKQRFTPDMKEECRRRLGAATGTRTSPLSP